MICCLHCAVDDPLGWSLQDACSLQYCFGPGERLHDALVKGSKYVL